jgi:hypothetical protein
MDASTCVILNYFIMNDKVINIPDSLEVIEWPNHVIVGEDSADLMHEYRDAVKAKKLSQDSGDAEVALINDRSTCY